jgi:hypothetical protein
VGWQEEELFGWVELEQRLTSERPGEAALTSWLIREAEAGGRVLRANGLEVGGEGLYLAVSLRCEGSTVGFLVLGFAGRTPRRLALALAACADEIEAAFAAPAARDQPEELPRAISVVG